MTTVTALDKEKPSLRIPLLLRIVSILILIEGMLGMLLFVSAGIFQLNDPNFIGSIGLNGFSSNFYSFYIVLHIIIFTGLLISGFFLLKLKKIAYYLFISNYLVLSLITIYTNEVFGWSTIIIGLVFLAILTYFRKSMI